MKPHIYRNGDQVEILKPLWVKRVGYKLHWQDLVAEVEAAQSTSEILRLLDWRSSYVPPFFLQALAKMRVEQQHFGGNERAIIYKEIEKPEADLVLDCLWNETVPHHGYVGHVVEVYGKRVAYTGTRYPACGHGEDWEPGCLDKRQAHVILRTTYGEIEACNVKLVKAAPKCR